MKISISLQSDLHKAAQERAAEEWDGNVSAYIAALIAADNKFRRGWVREERDGDAE